MAMTDMMVDIETTHTNPGLGGILQLSAVKFNYETGEIGEVFDRCPMLFPMRVWSDGTRDFWSKHRDVYQGIVLRQEPAIPVFQDFAEFARKGAPEDGFRFWSKPLSFDWPFIASHYEQLGMDMPFYYRIARDMNSFISGQSGNPEHISLDSVVDFNGDPHNALHDCAYQIDCLMYAKRRFVAAETVE